MRTRFLIFLAMIVFAEIYSFILVRSFTRTMPTGWKTTVMVAYILLSIFTWSSFFLLRNINGSMPHMLRNFIVAFTMGFWVAKILIGGVMLLDDVRRLVLWTINAVYKGDLTEQAVEGKGTGISRSVFFKQAALILGGSALGAFLYGITNRYNYQIKRIKINFDNLPAAFRGLKIVQISDIHTGSFDNHNAVQKGIDKILAEQPDIIFFTGDLVNDRADEIEPYADILSQLKAPMGVYSTLGNHDYGDYVTWPSEKAKRDNLERLKLAHGALGWKLMMNEHIVFEKGEDKIAVLGIENWGAKAGFPKYGDMKAAYNGLPEQNVPFKILLSHDPSHWDNEVLPQYPDVDLTLSGHTHGMQFGIEIPGFKWSPSKYVYKNWAGLYKDKKQHLYVNRGFGFLGYPGRLGILPEITVIELV
jgi:predicted MPP superfamily phosphohydrolase